MSAPEIGLAFRAKRETAALLLFAVLALAGGALMSMPSLKMLRNSNSMTEAAASELNHHLAGYLLIFISAMALASLIFAKLQRLRFVWPLVFIALGLFLAAWSDAELWPRGSLSWSWLIHHDAEARQHKIYAVILLAIGGIELLRAQGKLHRKLQTWALPVLAIIGAWLLTMHAHGGTSGLPAGWNPSQSVGQFASLDAAASQSMATSEHHHHHDSSNAPPHESGMTDAMRNIQTQHLWMTITGVVFAVTKFLADRRSSYSRFMQFCWPSAMACLGVLLIMYRE